MSDKSKVRFHSSEHDDRDTYRVNLRGLTKEEVDRLEASLRTGHEWFRRTEDGRLAFSPTFEPPPPIEDAEIVPFWRRLDESKTGLQTTLFDPKRLRDSISPGIFIRYLCGYENTPERYAETAALLEGYGFRVLRSRRQGNGDFEEAWMLSYLGRAKGALKEAITAKKSPDQLDQAVSFLCSYKSHVSFGTLDVVVQRAAMPVDGAE